MKKLLVSFFILFSSIQLTYAQLDSNMVLDYELQASDGTKVKLSDYTNNKYVFIEFFATWCPTCLFEMKYMDKIYPELNENVEFLSVSLDKEIDAYLSFTQKKKFHHDWPVLYGGLGSDFHKFFNVREFPTFFLFDKTGKMIPLKYDFASDGIEEQLQGLK